MARGLAETAHDEKPRQKRLHDDGGDCDGSGGGDRSGGGGTRQAPALRPAIIQ
jgi:hypothetical protein